MSGVLFWGWDIAGFSEELPSAELYLRSTAMATFCPIMQYHSEYTPAGAPSKDRTPWNIQAHTGDERVIAVYRWFAHLRMQLLPYIRTEAAHCAATGEPLMRPLLLDNPDDPIAWQMTDQYCFGRDLLVAPVIEPGATQRKLYLPRGEWRDLWDGSISAGGQWIVVEAPLNRIPVFVRADAAFQLPLL
jgi:alpha-glucosidase (family GH31 glycosyl hydrolase)